jgi:pre-mRNA-processing factor 17
MEKDIKETKSSGAERRSLVPTVYSKESNVLRGHTESLGMNLLHFESQRLGFNRNGMAANPSPGGAMVHKNMGLLPISSTNVNVKSRKRKDRGSASDVDGFAGPWAGYEGEKVGSEHLCGPSAEELARMEHEMAKDAHVKTNNRLEYIKPGEERSIFHGANEKDYLGRTYMASDTDYSNASYNEDSNWCYVPKRLIHTWSGHSKAVMSIQFFPKTFHLLLSSSMDGKAKIWDVNHQKKCLRTLIGHNKAVREAIFSPDGKQILTASYDKDIKLWDTETGACIQRYSPGAIPYCIAFHPDNPDVFLAGCSNKRMYQWDTRISSREDGHKVVREYNEHMDTVNTITFIDGNRRIVTTSDDKSIRIWEWDIPVSIKTISEPNMHAIAAVAVHPSKNHMIAQSMDSKLSVYECSDTVKYEARHFIGHNLAGYACKPSFSPDGQYVMSGDGYGGLSFWNWRTSKLVKSMHVHDKVTIGCLWHPCETSKVVTCSWDGAIKYWD